jgi:hypothetical protein
MTLAKARIINYDRNCSFIVLATVIMIVNYDRHLFIVQATGCEIRTLNLKFINQVFYPCANQIHTLDVWYSHSNIEVWSMLLILLAKN